MTFAWYDRVALGRAPAIAVRGAERAAKDEEATATLDEEAIALETCWAEERIMMGKGYEEIFG